MRICRREAASPRRMTDDAAGHPCERHVESDLSGVSNSEMPQRHFGSGGGGGWGGGGWVGAGGGGNVGDERGGWGVLRTCASAVFSPLSSRVERESEKD